MKIGFDPKLEAFTIVPDIGEPWIKHWVEHVEECKIVCKLVQEAITKTGKDKGRVCFYKRTPI